MKRSDPEPDGPAAADRERFDRLYRSTRDRLLAHLLRRLGDPDRAVDLLAEAYLIAWRRREHVPRPEDEAIAWLYGVARNLVAADRRSAARARELGERLRAELRAGPTVGVAPDDGPGETMAELRRALATLKPSDQELLVLSGVEELSPAQVAVVLDLPVGVVRVRLHRARRRLRRAQDDQRAADGRHGRPILGTPDYSPRPGSTAP